MVPVIGKFLEAETLSCMRIRSSPCARTIEPHAKKSGQDSGNHCHCEYNLGKNQHQIVALSSMIACCGFPGCVLDFSLCPGENVFVLLSLVSSM